MYPHHYATQHPDRPAIIMAESGETITYARYEARSNQLAHYLRANGLNSGDHYSIFMENHPRYAETNSAGERAGLYYTCVNSYLKADELAYIINNSESKLLITSASRLEVARQALTQCPDANRCLVVDPADLHEGEDALATVEAMPITPIEDEELGMAMLYSSGTTGQPKGIVRPLPGNPPNEPLPLYQFLNGLWQYREDMVFLSPAPLYHSAPHVAANLAIRLGATLVVMERFDPEHYLALIEKHKVTHTQLVPTMFSKMLKLPAEVRNRYDLSSLEFAVHAAAPCPVQVKEQMIEWWGPIVHEYYGATEGLGFTACNSEEWLSHRGSVGKVMLGDLHILDDDMKPCPRGTAGTVWFTTASEFAYFNDPERTAEATSPDGTMTTVGDVGYLDEDNYLYLTDRATFMIVSGGVNIYPQECENLLITHPKVADAAVFGVPNEEFGEEVKAVVQPMPEVAAGQDLEEELIEFCHANLSKLKCPKSIDFDPELPRPPTGKLYKRVLRDRYWGDRKSRIL